MAYLYAYYSTVILIAVFAVSAYLQSCSSDRFKSNIRFKRNRVKELKGNIQTRLYNQDLDNLFLSSGIKLSSFTYNLLRYSFFGAWISILLLNFFFNGYLPKLQLIVLIVLFILTIPKLKIFDRNTPFNYFITFLTFDFKHKKNLEINRALSQLKNLSIISSSVNIGSDFIINELMKLTKLTKPIFTKTLKYLRENDKVAAADYFAAAIDTREGREMANIFLKLDDLGPDELKEQIILTQSMFKEEKQSAKEKKNEYRGYFLYSIVIVTIFVILLNFVTLILYVNTAEVFNNLNFEL
jgi:hypothetical protein